MSADVRVVDAEELARLLPRLASLHLDAIRSGMALGFVEPVTPEQLEGAWRATVPEVERGVRIVVCAWRGETCVGTAQLVRGSAVNADHRAEVQRVVVAREARGSGVGRAVMEALEREARRAGLALLYLTTHDETDACAFYEQLGWQRLGAMPAYTRRPDGRLWPSAFYYRVLS